MNVVVYMTLDPFVIMLVNKALQRVGLGPNLWSMGPHASLFLGVIHMFTNHRCVSIAWGPAMGSISKPKTQPISGLGWVGLWDMWAVGCGL